MSSSDETVDSDELSEILQRKNVKKVRPIKPRVVTRTVHAMSDSADSSDSDEVEVLPSGKDSADAKSKKHHDSLSSSNRRKTGESSPSATKAAQKDEKLHASKSLGSSGAETSKRSAGSYLDASVKKSRGSPCQENFDLHTYFGCFFTKVSGISSRFNDEKIAMGIKDLLSRRMGNLKKSAQFNYMIDLQWLLHQYPEQFRSCPLLLVYGLRRGERDPLAQVASQHSNITLCHAKLEIAYGTHHTKMMLMLYDEGMRVVIHTSNLIADDWHQKTQGMWVSPIFPPLQKQQSGSCTGDSHTNFRADLLEYLSSYKKPELDVWCKHIKEHDFSAAKVYLIASFPGRHVAPNKSSFGHLKLRKVLNSSGPKPSTVSSIDWPVIGQFSSIGSLGSDPDQWLCKEFLDSLATVEGAASSLGNSKAELKLIFPSVDNVRTSLEGYPAGASLPYSINVARKQPYLREFLHLWHCEVKGRSKASPHIKTYLRASKDTNKLAWFLITSANLSKAAWGCLEKGGSQLMIRSYELGVLFLPKAYNGKADYFHLSKETSSRPIGESNVPPFPMFYDLPPIKYSSSDMPWIWDIPHISAPDTHGNKWCPK